MNIESLSPNLQAAVRSFSKMSREDVISSLNDEKFVESLSISDEELKAIHRFIEEDAKSSGDANVQEWWA